MAGFLDPEYPIIHLALRCVDHTPNPLPGGERSLAGDIICARLPLDSFGKKEIYSFLWIPVWGLEFSDMPRLEMLLHENPNDPESEWYDRRRFCIPFSRLQTVYPDFDPIAASDLTLCYQPFFEIDDTALRYSFVVPPFSVHGLIYDKFVGEYL